MPRELRRRLYDLQLRDALGTGRRPVRVVPRPVDEAEKARLVARDRKWLERCNPIVERDRYGVGRLRYAAPGCEFGVSED